MTERERRAAIAAAMYGGGGDPPWMRPERDAYGGSTLGDLIGRRGQAEAQYHANSGNILAEGVREASRTLAGFFQEKAEKQEMAKRDAATMAAIEAWDGQDPTQLFAGLQKIRPQDALQYTNAVLSLRKGPQKDPNQELERLGKMAQFLGDQDDAVIARAWPHIRESFGSTAERLGLPLTEQWDPQARPLLGKIGETFGPKRESKLVPVPAGGLYDPEKGEIVAKPAEKKDPGHKVTVAGPGGVPMAKLVTDEELAAGVQEYREPRAARTPSLERIETVGPDGKTVQMFVEPKPGSTYASPAKAPPQQRLTKDERTHFAAINYSLPKMDAFANYVRSNPGNYGTWDAFRKGLTQAVPGFAEGDYATQQAFIGRLNAEIRHALFGANLTEGEKESARGFMIDARDQPPVILAKLKEASDRARSDMDYYGSLGFTIPGAPSQGGSPGGGPVTVRTLAERDKLAPGTLYVGPDGKTRRKK